MLLGPYIITSYHTKQDRNSPPFRLILATHNGYIRGDVKMCSSLPLLVATFVNVV